MTRTGFSGTNLLFAFAAGAAVGTIAALLLAPAKGEEVRHKLSETAREASKKPKELARRVSGALHRGAEVAEEEIAEAIAQAS